MAQYWWLRSPGDFSNYAAGVYSQGFVDNVGFAPDSGEGVRPAFWISIQ
jgi:hypothetical protein